MEDDTENGTPGILARSAIFADRALRGPLGSATALGSSYRFTSGLIGMLNNLAPTSEEMEAQYGVDPKAARGEAPTSTIPDVTPDRGYAGDAASAASDELGVPATASLVEEQQEAKNKYYLPDDYLPPDRMVVTDDGNKSYVYRGTNRVGGDGRFRYGGPDGNIPLGRYDVMNEWSTELGRMDSRERKALFGALYERGLYGGSKPSPTLLDPDREGRVMRLLLFAANIDGRTWESVAMDFINQVQVQPERRLAQRDINRFVQAAAQQMIGRNLRPKEMSAVSGSVQGAYGAGADASTAARQAIEQKYRPEADALNFSKYADLLTRLMR